jgi:hypothetical protein
MISLQGIRKLQENDMTPTSSPRMIPWHLSEDEKKTKYSKSNKLRTQQDEKATN